MWDLTENNAHYGMTQSKGYSPNPLILIKPTVPITQFYHNALFSKNNAAIE